MRNSDPNAESAFYPVRLAWLLTVLIAIAFHGCVEGVGTARAEEQAPIKKIVLIGGLKSHGPAEHEFPSGIRLLTSFIESSPDLQGRVSVAAYPNGWPRDDAALEGASTIIWYFDGLDGHPLLDAGRRTKFEALMKRGAGVIALHQASTVPANDRAMEFERWLGGARYGMVDRTTEAVAFMANPQHPVSRGVEEFTHVDEFYPTIRFEESRRVTPILTGKLHVQYHGDKPLVIDEPIVRPVAWTFEREGGGRSFVYTGLHYLPALDQPQLRKLLLNAIAWTAGMDVPAGGVRSGMPDAAMKVSLELARSLRRSIADAVVTRAGDRKVVDQEWGRLTWYASGELQNSDTMTVGQAVIRPGKENPRHFHPNCDEVLHVVQGRVLHSIGDRSVELSAGDTVSIPMGVLHNAKNIGDQDAVLSISYSSADRQVVGE